MITINLAKKILIQDDCLEAMKSIPDNSIDMVLCDPPYGTTKCKWDCIIPFEKMWLELDRIVKRNGAKVFFASQPFTSLLGSSNIKELKYSWVWKKTRPTMFLQAKKQPLKGFEDILVFYKSPPTYNPQGVKSVDWEMKNSGTKARGNTKLNGDITSVHNGIRGKSRQGDNYKQSLTNYPRGIIEFGQESPSFHPTQKPVKLLEYLIQTYTNPGEIVLDFTMGSGSTGVACMNTGRNFIGIERDEKYFEICQQRIGA